MLVAPKDSPAFQRRVIAGHLTVDEIHPIGQPDATAGLILAELQNRRARSSKEKQGEVGAPSGGPAVLEQVLADDQGEPARLVLYLTADEVKYILTLLAEKVESWLRHFVLNERMCRL